MLLYFFIGIDGRVDMKLTCGITVAEEKVKVGKEGKFILAVMIKKRKQLELMILLHSSTGAPPPPPTFRRVTMRRNWRI